MDEQRAVQLFTQLHPKYSYIETPKDKPSDIDAFLVYNNVLRAVVETKCRYDCDYEKFMGAYGGTWLITYEKIEKAKNIAKALCIRAYGFLYLKQSDLLMVQQIADEEGNFCGKISIARTKTQATINGGTAYRTNAYIDMSGSTIIKDK